MTFKFTTKGSNSNIIQKYLNTIPDTDIWDYQRTFKGVNAEFELYEVPDQETFDKIIKGIKEKGISVQINENKMTPKQEKYLTEKYIRPMVKRMLKEKNNVDDFFNPTLIPNFDKIVDQYGLIDILYSAMVYYKKNHENLSVEMVDKCLRVIKTFYKKRGG